MLEHTFIFLDRITLDGEQRLWKQGIADWQSFLETKKIPGVSPSRKIHYDRQLRKAGQLLHERDLFQLAALLPRSEHWRLYDLFPEQLALDIETSGYYGDITVLGLDDGETHFLVQGKNLFQEAVVQSLSRPNLLLTFNGSSFDLPVLARAYPAVKNILLRAPHIDLRHVAARLGFSGGLKIIEEELGIGRGEGIHGMHGGDACDLWALYRTFGDEHALKMLLDYNAADTRNLHTLAEMLIPRLWSRTRYGRCISATVARTSTGRSSSRASTHSQ